MKNRHMALTALLIAAAIPLVSCGAVGKIGKGSVSMMKRSTSATVNTLAAVKMPKMPKIGMPKMPSMSLAGLIPGRGPKVVEVREKDLKELPTGKELAQAHERERRGFWIFGGPVDFKEPTLPAPGAELDGTLLPPRMP